MITSYKTIARNGEGTYREKGSKFIGVAFHVIDADDMKEQLSLVKKAHHAARHYCSAFVLETDASYFKSNDDGEPNGTAGTPILRKLQLVELTYAGVVVVRYFGGTKLGKAGLVRAYGEAAKLAIGDSKVIIENVLQTMHAKCSMADVEVLRGEILSRSGQITNEAYAQQAELSFQLPITQVSALRERFALSQVRFTDQGPS